MLPGKLLSLWLFTQHRRKSSIKFCTSCAYPPRMEPALRSRMTRCCKGLVLEWESLNRKQSPVSESGIKYHEVHRQKYGATHLSPRGPKEHQQNSSSTGFKAEAVKQTAAELRTPTLSMIVYCISGSRWENRLWKFSLSQGTKSAAIWRDGC